LNAQVGNALAALVVTTAPDLAPESVVQTFDRVVSSLEFVGLPEQNLVSVDKPIAEEACP
jgi:hypothetical protein